MTEDALEQLINRRIQTSLPYDRLMPRRIRTVLP